MRSLKTAFQQIRRTPYQSLVATLTLSLAFFAMAVFILISAGTHMILRYFEAAPQVIAFFEKGKDLSDEELTRIKNRLEATGKLADFKYVSTREAEQIYKDKNKSDPLLNELVDYKILPPSIEISAIGIAELSDLKSILDTEPLVTDISYYEDIVGQLSMWIQNIRLVGLGMVGFLLILSMLLLVVIISLKIKNKRREIEIMRLLGASRWYINSPFLVEGMVYGALGAFFGWLGGFTLLQYSTPYIVEWLEEIIAFPIDITLLLMLLGIMILGGMTVGAFSSLVAVRRFSKI